jgi:hypothetical protein
MHSLFPGNTFLLFLKNDEIDHENTKSETCSAGAYAA